MGSGGQDSAPGPALVASSGDHPGERSPRGEPSSSCAEAAGHASAARGQGDGSSPPSLTIAEEPGRAEVGLGLYAEQPDPRHLVQLGNAFI